MRFTTRHALALAAASVAPVAAITLDITSTDSVKAAASAVAAEMMTYYTGNEPGGTPGILPEPYYWWEAGAMMGCLIDYWYYTGDTTYNDIVKDALVFQESPTYDFMPANQTKDEGNDDQVFWAFAAMSAAEYNFPAPPSGPSWISLAEAVFNSQALRWDNATCGGGLRWQIFEFNNGYNYKNAPSNAGLMNLASRLYLYTANSTYKEWAEKEWDWLSDIGLISDTYAVYDGSNDLLNCSQLDHVQWSYSAGMVLNAAAVMYNTTNDTIWETRALDTWNTTASVFFKDKIMFEQACETSDDCDTDQLSFKAYLARWMAASTKVMPTLYDTIQPYLAASASACAAQCTGGTSGNECGTKWTTDGVWDGTTGVGQQMCALEIIQGNLITEAASPVTETTGGTSKGNATLGTGGDNDGDAIVLATITTADRAGAGILTAVVILGVVTGGWWVVS